MDRKHLKLLLLTLAAMLAAVSCRKDNNEDERAYMSGSLTFDMPTYAVVGQKISSYVTGITTPSDVDYFWVSQDIDISESDTVYSQSVTFTLPDEPGEYSITVYARAEEYYSSTRTVSIQVITPDMNGAGGWQPGTSEIVDERDGIGYPTRVYGSLEWFTQNLRFAGYVGNRLGRPYDDSEGIDRIFGRLYSWNDATGGKSGSGLGGGPQGACPPGWSVPTLEDWEDFASAVGGQEYDFFDHWSGIGEAVSAPITLNESAMWPYSPDNLHTDAAGWNGFPTGNSRDSYGEFENISVYGMWWCSSEMDGGTVPYRYIYYNTDTFDVYYTDKDSYGVSVRCVRLATSID